MENKPKRAPPARFAKKDQEEEKQPANEDVDMNVEEVKKPTPKAPPKKEAPPKTAKAPGKGSSAVAPP